MRDGTAFKQNGICFDAGNSETQVRESESRREFGTSPDRQVCSVIDGDFS